jgi:hypothetical protein
VNQTEIVDLLTLRGVAFLKALTNFEERRFSDSRFMKGSTFEQINVDFGLFPSAIAYPVYFAGDVTKPSGKTIFGGINPGYSDGPRQTAEQHYLQSRGSFNGYCRIFADFFAQEKKGLLPYFADIGGFLRRYFDLREEIDWSWLQENLISLDLIPYHSQKAAGLRIRNPENFRRTYFEIFLRILDHLDPSDLIFFHGFPTFADELANDAFKDVVEFHKKDGFWIGKFDRRFNFIGLPFLTRVSGGKDALVDKIKRYQKSQR